MKPTQKDILIIVKLLGVKGRHNVTQSKKSVDKGVYRQ